MDTRTWVDVIVLLAGFLIAIGAQRQGQSDIKEDVKAILEGQKAMFAKTGELDSRMAAVETWEGAHEKRDDERHQRSEQDLDEVKGDIKRHSREIHQLWLRQGEGKGGD